MNYSKHYHLLVTKAQNRTFPKGTYFERHHIVPKCLGGTDSKENLIKLTPEEHFLAHLLLVKMNPGHRGLIFAAHMMTVGNNNVQRSSNKQYGWLKKKMKEKAGPREFRHSEETKQKMSKDRTGAVRPPHSEETKKKQSIAAKNRPPRTEKRVFSEQALANIAAAAKTRKSRGPDSEETKRKKSESQKQRKHR